MTRPDTKAIRARVGSPDYADFENWRTDVPALVARVEELEAALRNMVDTVDRIGLWRRLYSRNDGSLLFPEPKEFDAARAALADAPVAADPATGATNDGHGHVRPRPDGVRARCGGPAICKECAFEAARHGR